MSWHPNNPSIRRESSNEVVVHWRLSSPKVVFHRRSSSAYHSTLVDLIFVRTVNIPNLSIKTWYKMHKAISYLGSLLPKNQKYYFLFKDIFVCGLNILFIWNSEFLIPRLFYNLTAMHVYELLQFTLLTYSVWIKRNGLVSEYQISWAGRSTLGI